MQTSITKWGNSLAVRLPKPFTDQMGINSTRKVEIILQKDQIIIKKSPQKLDELLEQITPENIHTETETGSITGKEIW
ncbi:AbrB/MazE/SpoVT family DNA-binding domain-containing protein [Patescibacteria group bacterium]|nr:AbrB/MazE/SpoVT family DNA-binding domain-containing protein [Patescibacteria group bacterium]